MARGFELTFPLALVVADRFWLDFRLVTGRSLHLGEGLYCLQGANGSGKTTLLNLLALTAGRIGPRPGPVPGFIRFDGEAYNGRGFNHIRAAEIRRRHFCIFPQKVFFLPVSTRDNYAILNGSDPARARRFSPREFPAALSGGQQQQTLMDMVLDPAKPVWFLDEPLSNLDAARQRYFWQILAGAWRAQVRMVFFVDHGLQAVIAGDPAFDPVARLRVRAENRYKGRLLHRAEQHIEILYNKNPQTFLRRQMEAAAGRAGDQET